MDKPILFNTPMVQALLEDRTPKVKALPEDRKTMTRRVVTSRNSRGMWNSFAHKKWEQIRFNAARAVNIGAGRIGLKAPWKDSVYWVTLRPIWYPGDLLWVRETWWDWTDDCVLYRADGEEYISPCETPSGGYPASCRNHPGCDGCQEEEWKIPWRPSIHMPRWASRFTLRVTDVRVERVREISEKDAIAEGVENKLKFSELWDMLNKSKGFGWDANPFVWVISFEVIEKNVDEVRG